MLEEPDFRWLLSGQFVAQTADGFAQATFANVLVLEPTSAQTPEQIFYLFALTLLPYSAISPFIGVFVDRWARRSLMTWSNVVRGGLLATLPLWGRALPGDLAYYAAILLLLSFGRVFLTTKGALLPVLLHERHLIGGNSLSSGGGMIAAVLGGAVGLFGSSGLGRSTAFVLAGAMYVLAAVFLRRLSDPYAHPHPSAENPFGAIVRIAAELLAGLKEIWVHVRARLALIGIFLVRTVTMFVFVAVILEVKDAYPGRAEEFGRLSISALALGAFGAGAFVGATTAPFAGRRLEKAGLIVFGSCISGIGVLALGGIDNPIALLLLTFFGGYGAFVTKVAVDAQVQEALPDAYRGRAFALYDILFNLASVVAGAFIVMTQAFARRPTLFFAGFIGLVLAAALGVTMARAGMELIKTSEASEQRA